MECISQRYMACMVEVAGMKDDQRFKRQHSEELNEESRRVVEMEESASRRELREDRNRRLIFFQQLLDAIPIPVFYKDIRGVYCGCNRAFEKFLGSTKDQIVRKTVYEAYPHDLAEVYYKADTALFSHPETQVHEASVLHADGSIHDVVFNKATFVDADGRVAGLVGGILDITEHKRAEAELKEQRDRLEKINGCLLELGADHVSNINRLTAICGEMLGADCALYNRMQGDLLYSVGRWQIPPDFLEGSLPEGRICCDVIHHSDDKPVLVTDLPRTPYFESDPHVRQYGLKTYFGQAVKCEGKPVGALCVVYKTDYLPSDDDKRVLGFIASAIGNEDSRMQKEELLRQSEAKYRLLTEKTNDVVWTMDLDFNLTYISPSIEKVTGFEPEEFMQKYQSESLTPASLGYIMDILYAELKRDHEEGVDPGRTIRLELEYFRKDGSTVWMELLCTAIRDNSGRIIGVHGVSRDITERRKAALERGNLVRELQQALAEVKTLSGMLPICAGCKKIRDDTGYWNQIESYITKHSDAVFTHSLCPECVKRFYPD